MIKYNFVFEILSAEVAELVDALDSKSSGAQNSVPVRLRPSVQNLLPTFLDYLITIHLNLFLLK